MEATNTLIKLGTELQTLIDTPNPGVQERLLLWLKAGNLEKLKEGVITFLSIAAIQENGTSYVEEKADPKAAIITNPDDIKTLDVLQELRTRYDEVEDLAAALDEDTASSLLAYYLAGQGYTSDQINSMSRVELEETRDILQDDPILAFLQGYGNDDLLTKGLNVEGLKALLRGKESAFPRVEDTDLFIWYLAGRGLDYNSAQQLTRDEAAGLAHTFETKNVNLLDNFEAFLAGLA